MMDYKDLYYFLFNRITDSIHALENNNFGTAKEILVQAQQAAEEIFLETQND